MLNPPPMLRVSGPLFPLLTTATLSSILSPIQSSSPFPMSSQTHSIPLLQAEPESTQQIPGRLKRSERASHRRKLLQAAAKSGFGAALPSERRKALAKERDILAEGLAFSGLWVGEEVGKGKEFRLELKLGQPGMNPSPGEEATHHTSIKAAEVLEERHDGHIDQSAFLEDQQNVRTSDENRGEVVDAVATLEEHLRAISEADQNSRLSAIPNVDNPVRTGQQSKPWATFISAPLTIVSKPSQKTAKARSMASCLSERDSVSLWVRIHGQTVRTKYMKLEPGEPPRLTAKTGKWTPFRFEVIRRALPPVTSDKPSRSRSRRDGEEDDAGVLTYGSTVVLVDLQSGVATEPVKLIKVGRNEAVVGEDEGHPISELQRVGLVRLGADEGERDMGGRWYLSAPGARAGGGETVGPPGPSRQRSRKIPRNQAVKPETLGGAEHEDMQASSALEHGDQVQTPSKRQKTKRNALALASLAEAEEGSSQSVLSWTRAEKEDREITVSNGKEVSTRRVVVEKVEDWMCWVIGGVCKSL